MKSKAKFSVLSWQGVEKKLTHSYSLRQLLANIAGICACFSYFAFFDEIIPRVSGWSDTLFFTLGLSAGLIVLGTILANLWMKEIRNFVKQKINKTPISKKLSLKAENKILNLPIASAAISLFNWWIASIIMPFCFITQKFTFQMTPEQIENFFSVAIGIFISGIVTSVMVFFHTELTCRPIWERFFPKGEFILKKGVFRINLWSRILIIFLLASLFPLADMALVSYEKAQMMLTTEPAVVLKSLRSLILFLLTVEFTLVVFLSMFMSRSIVAPILELKSAMRKVGKGDFTARARVIDNNELGVLSRNFNQMTQGLKERYELLRSLEIAKQVQQNLLPDKMPVIDGLDIAGKSLYCDQTGGDYFDFIDTKNSSDSKVIALGDVSGHGIPAALLMASARAFLRQRIALSGSLDNIVNDVNIQFCKDVGESGRFMTLFLLAYDIKTQTLTWVRAGHDPAMLYDPKPDEFKELKGQGIPLGIDDLFCYNENTITDISPGQILFIGTDGIWESCNAKGKMFGKENVMQIIKKHQNKSAHQIMYALLEALKEFMGDQTPDDDITLIIIKRI